MLAFNLRPSVLAAASHDQFMQTALDDLFATPFVLSRCAMVPSLAQHIVARVTEDKEAYVMTVEAPGVKADELSISFEYGVLTVSCSKESAYGTISFKRQAKLPNADAGSAEATHKDGVLTITLKKVMPPAPVAITVCDVLDSAPTSDDDNDEEEARRVLAEMGFESEGSAKPYTLTIAAPGVKAADIRVEASQAALSIHGETRSAHGSFSVHRNYKLPRDADAAAATATHVDGILRITLPTKAAPAVIAIEIRGMATEEAEATTKACPSEVAETCASAAEAVEEAPEAAKHEAREKAGEKVGEEWVAEWDAMLEDLAEMGFKDRASSREALAKHAGSLKAAVKELVTSRAGM